MNVYVGNLPWSISEDELRKMFEEFGQVTSAAIVMDRVTNKSRGFGFVEMADDKEAQAAINGLNGKSIDERTLTVNEARPRTERRDNFRRDR